MLHTLLLEEMQGTPLGLLQNSLIFSKTHSLFQWVVNRQRDMSTQAASFLVSTLLSWRRFVCLICIAFKEILSAISWCSTAQGSHFAKFNNVRMLIG